MVNDSLMKIAGIATWIVHVSFREKNVGGDTRIRGNTDTLCTAEMLKQQLVVQFR